MNTNLGSILSEAQIIPDLRAANRWEAIDELIRRLIETGNLKPAQREAVTAAVRRRESTMSTGIGLGVGIPHASTDLIVTAVAALGRSQTGIEFAALDGQPVRLVMLFLIPQGQFQKQLPTVAEIAKLMHTSEVREALQKAPDAGAMLQIIRTESSASPTEKTSPNHRESLLERSAPAK